MWLNGLLDESVLMLGFSVLVVVVAARMWLQASKQPESTKVTRTTLGKNDNDRAPICQLNQNKPLSFGAPCIAGLVFGAGATGVLSGLFGVGGGFLIVPALLALTGISIRQAVATSLLVISVVSFSGFLSFLGSKELIEITVLLQVGGAGLVGMSFGLLLSKKIAGPVLQKIFSILMLVIAIFTVTNTLF